MKYYILLTTIVFSQVKQNDYLPYVNKNDSIINHFAYSLIYNEHHEQASWIAYELTVDQVKGTFKRINDFRVDPEIKTGSALLSDYRGSGYDRGHLAPAADMKWSTIAMSESFFMSNMSPQNPSFNRGIWKRLENQLREWALDEQKLYIVTGGVLKEGLETIGENQVSIPEYFYKVVLDYEKPVFKGIGFILRNEKSEMPLEKYAVSIDSVEQVTGIDFYYSLPDSIEDSIESIVNLSMWFKNQ